MYFHPLCLRCLIFHIVVKVNQEGRSANLDKKSTLIFKFTPLALLLQSQSRLQSTVILINSSENNISTSPLFRYVPACKILGAC